MKAQCTSTEKAKIIKKGKRIVYTVRSRNKKLKLMLPHISRLAGKAIVLKYNFHFFSLCLLCEMWNVSREELVVAVWYSDLLPARSPYIR